MKLEYDRTKKELVQSEEIEGLFKATYKHKIEGTEASISYRGPKISPVLWAQIVGFCKWTYAEHKCEAQVRLFVDLKEKTWVAWAFPQEIETGLHTKEKTGPFFDRQREALPNAQDLIPYGTVHHHCSAGAFQSGTDHDDEKNQDGLHITLGNMDKPVPDMHSRLSMNNECYQANLSAFWDIGDFDDDKKIPPDLRSRIAEYQMLNIEPSEEFPEEWRKNMIKTIVVHVSRIHEFGIGGYNGSSGITTIGGVVQESVKSTKEKEEAMEKRLVVAVKELFKEYVNGDFLAVQLADLDGMTVFNDIVRIAEKNMVHASDLFDGAEREIAEKELQSELKQIRDASKSDKWEPRYEGNGEVGGRPQYVIHKLDQVSVQRWASWAEADAAAKNENESESKEAELNKVWNDGMGVS